MSGPVVVLLGVACAQAGVRIECVETTEHAAVAAFAPEETRGSAFGLLATVQAVGNVAAGVIAGLLRQRGITPRIARRGVAQGSCLGKVRWVIERGFAWLHAFNGYAPATSGAPTSTSACSSSPAP